MATLPTALVAGTAGHVSWHNELHARHNLMGFTDTSVAPDPVRTVTMTFSAETESASGTQGLKINRSDFGLPVGISLRHVGVAKWDTATLDFETDDLVLAFDHSSSPGNFGGDIIRLSMADDSTIGGPSPKIVMGAGVGSPVNEPADVTVIAHQQFGHQVRARTSASVSGGYYALFYGDRWGLLLDQAQAGTLRHKIGLGNGSAFTLLTDRSLNGTRDFAIRDQSNNADRLIITPGGGIYLGGQINATDTDGHTQIPNCAGPPTGIPAVIGGATPIIYDKTNGRLYAYTAALGPSWRSVALT